MNSKILSLENINNSFFYFVFCSFNRIFANEILKIEDYGTKDWR